MGVRVSWGRMERDESKGKRGVRVPGGRLVWHPKTRSFFGKIANLLKGRKMGEEELFRENRVEGDDGEGRYDDRRGRYDEYYGGEDEVSEPGSLTTASTRQTTVATSAVGGTSRAGFRVPSRTALRKPSRRPTAPASSRISSTVGSRPSTAHSSALSSSALSRHVTRHSRASSRATIRAKPTKLAPQNSLDDHDISPLIDEMNDDIFVEDYAFTSHSRAKIFTKWSPRDSQAGSEQ